MQNKMETAIVWFRVQGVGLRIWRLGLMSRVSSLGFAAVLLCDELAQIWLAISYIEHCF